MVHSHLFGGFASSPTQPAEQGSTCSHQGRRRGITLSQPAPDSDPAGGAGAVDGIATARRATIDRARRRSVRRHWGAVSKAENALNYLDHRGYMLSKLLPF